MGATMLRCITQLFPRGFHLICVSAAMLAASDGQARSLESDSRAPLSVVPVAETQQTITGPGGQTGTRSKQLNCAPEDSSCTATGQVTGPGGQSTTRSRQLNCSPGDSSCSATGQATGPSGKSASRSRQLNCAPGDRACTATGQATGPGGRSASRSRQRSGN